MKKLAGYLFIAGAVIVNIPYYLLIQNFNYPDILREPSGQVLTKFAEGGSGLIYTWLAFALAGFPLLFAVLILNKVWANKSRTLLSLATTFGVIGLLAQLIGLLRWVFVVPVIAQEYGSQSASEATKAAAIMAFQAVNQFGGVLLGEYVGQLFTILSMIFFSLLILQKKLLSTWVAWLGFIASFVYIFSQTELIHTVIDTFPVIEIAGLLGSVLWIIWMICMGALLIRDKSTR